MWQLQHCSLCYCVYFNQSPWKHVRKRWNSLLVTVLHRQMCFSSNPLGKMLWIICSVRPKPEPTLSFYPEQLSFRAYIDYEAKWTVWLCWPSFENPNEDLSSFFLSLKPFSLLLELKLKPRKSRRIWLFQSAFVTIWSWNNRGSFCFCVSRLSNKSKARDSNQNKSFPMSIQVALNKYLPEQSVLPLKQPLHPNCLIFDLAIQQVRKPVASSRIEEPTIHSRKYNIIFALFFSCSLDHGEQ